MHRCRGVPRGRLSEQHGLEDRGARAHREELGIRGSARHVEGAKLREHLGEIGGVGADVTVEYADELVGVCTDQLNSS